MTKAHDPSLTPAHLLSLQIDFGSQLPRRKRQIKGYTSMNTSRLFISIYLMFHFILLCSASFLSGLCTNRDISISQSRGSSTGIPEYIVQIANTCLSGCAPFNIHFHCGWFASAKLVNPNTLKRLSFDDCLVNAGRPLRSSQIIRFTYTNSFMYPITFKSARFC
ncbi:TPD1 protein 1-like protein isoform X1 [Cinnamomum micranthum f. kanehirae]|uniref:TPD1 protein 1-like protein isoform X1 n=1 Tax=Cinnamomum micranthum f. kanehirae TaxID=337451 RepID=A0A3S4Q2F9_9MAGN|nr:TPD1 protein 1-like protein isoform X1 [Cinnamomum micranthum f. kanehirae]